jgi:hypothetical protein
LPSPDLSYRATVENWVGLPDYPPSGAALAKAGATTVYASWNGDTEVTAWRVLAGAGAKDLSLVASSTKTGFETAITVKGAYKTFEVEALNAKGKVIGTSRSFEEGNK